jgi:hypothetical protein
MVFLAGATFESDRAAADKSTVRPGLCAVFFVECFPKKNLIYGLRREKLGSAYEVQLMTKQTAFSILLHFYRI